MFFTQRAACVYIDERPRRPKQLLVSSFLATSYNGSAITLSFDRESDQSGTTLPLEASFRVLPSASPLFGLFPLSPWLTFTSFALCSPFVSLYPFFGFPLSWNSQTLTLRFVNNHQKNEDGARVGEREREDDRAGKMKVEKASLFQHSSPAPLNSTKDEIIVFLKKMLSIFSAGNLYELVFSL